MLIPGSFGLNYRWPSFVIIVYNFTSSNIGEGLTQ